MPLPMYWHNNMQFLSVLNGNLIVSKITKSLTAKYELLRNSLVGYIYIYIYIFLILLRLLWALLTLRHESFIASFIGPIYTGSYIFIGRVLCARRIMVQIICFSLFHCRTLFYCICCDS